MESITRAVRPFQHRELCAGLGIGQRDKQRGPAIWTGPLDFSSSYAQAPFWGISYQIAFRTEKSPG